MCRSWRGTWEGSVIARSELTIDIGAARRNVKTLLAALGGAELWAVVKADGYGHGAVDVANGALGAGATGLCTATVAEALVLRPEFPTTRIVVMGPASNREIAQAREARLELVVSTDGPLPEEIGLHLKLDTGMGRYGLSELFAPPVQVVGFMSHLATADSDPAFAEQQIERFREATAPYPGYLRHIANSAAALRIPSARFDAARCGIALHGLSPFGTDPAEDGLEPVLSWRSELAQVTPAAAGREHRLRADVRRRAADLDRDRARGLRRRLPPRPDRGRRCASTASSEPWSGRSRWIPSPSSCPASSPPERR